MLFSSRSRAYAHALKESYYGGRTLAPQASALGLTPESSVKTLNELHTMLIAEGVNTVGRKLIADSHRADSDNTDEACLGYLYRAQFANEEGELAPIRTHGSTRLRLEPKLVVRFAKAPDMAAGFEGFIDAIDAIAMAAELQQLPFADASWRFEDKICANGFSKIILSGELKTLSLSSKQHFSQLLDMSNFSVSRTSAAGSLLVDYTPGYKTVLSSIGDLYLLMQRGHDSTSGTGISAGDLVALNAICPAQPVAAGEEWICVPTGFDLGSLRIRFTS